jgi:hypothetical protein
MPSCHSCHPYHSSHHHYPPCPPPIPPRCNSEEVDYAAKYSKLLPISFDQNMTQKTLTYDEMLYSNIVINCDGTTDFTPNVYKLYLPDAGVQFSRAIRQYYQFEKIPINFLVSTYDIRLNGNAVLEVYINGVLFRSYINAIFYLSPTQIPPIKIRYPDNIFLYYAQSDDDEFKASPYYCERLLPPGPTTNCCS